MQYYPIVKQIFIDLRKLLLQFVVQVTRQK